MEYHYKQGESWMAKNKNVRNRRQKSRKNSGLRWHKRGIVLTTLVIVLLGGMVTAGSVSLWSRNNAISTGSRASGTD